MTKKNMVSLKNIESLSKILVIAQDICFLNDCDLDTLIDCLNSNLIRAEISDQIRYLVTGKLPGEK